MRQMFAVSILAIGVAVGGCDDGSKVADVPFAPIREAMNKDAQSFEAYFNTIKGQPVHWSGRVTEVLRQRGDDYVEEAYLLVDMDAPGQGSEAADVVFQIPVSALARLKAGQAVTYDAVIREFERDDEGVRLKLELKKLQE